MVNSSPIHDKLIYQEMMSHPAIFAHSKLKKIVIIGDNECAILHEVVKHSTITDIYHLTEQVTEQTIADERIHFVISDTSKWMTSTPQASLDLIIVAEDANPTLFKQYLDLLHEDGILVQQSGSLFDIETLKSQQQALIAAGSTDIHFLSFPQPGFTSGWRTALLAKKHGNIKRPKENHIFNKSFATRYYNFDIHKASLVLPEFMREELETATDE
jgi:spermidine synthase